MTALPPTLPSDADFELSGGRLCLDLANTVSWRKAADADDLLRSYAHLVAWARLAGLIDDARAEALLLAAGRRPSDAEVVLARAVALREAIHDAMHAVVETARVPPAAIEAINGELASGLPHARVVPAADGFAWGWDEGLADERALDRPLWAVARSAAELLVSDDLPRVRECAADRCGWLFMDTSKNKSRRWCDMATCGNRAKARRHYARTRGRSA
jgi:predicted RNA-binding Zn ribbon-like protein